MLEGGCLPIRACAASRGTCLIQSALLRTAALVIASVQLFFFFFFSTSLGVLSGLEWQGWSRNGYDSTFSKREIPLPCPSSAQGPSHLASIPNDGLDSLIW